MQDQIVECIPNFSVGRDRHTVEAIASAITAVKDCKLLDISSGLGAGRSVYSFLGSPEVVYKAAFAAISCATKAIDISGHQGVHPFIGATDVCPFVPLRNYTMQDCIALARKLGQKVGSELGIPVFLYEQAATSTARINLAEIRRGGLDQLAKKIQTTEWRPDFGPASLHPSAGAIAIGAREILIAFNINLVGRNLELAKKIASKIRSAASPNRSAFALKGVKAIGWVIEEYDCAQVSCNITRHQQSSLHHVFEAVRQLAETEGVEVAGSEIIGLVPKAAIIEAGKFYIKQTENLATLSESSWQEDMLIETAIEHLGLNSISPFIPSKRIIELAMQR